MWDLAVTAEMKATISIPYACNKQGHEPKYHVATNTKQDQAV